MQKKTSGRAAYERLTRDVDYLALNIEFLEDLFEDHPLFNADFYVKRGSRFIFYRKREYPITREKIRAWKEMGVTKIYLKVERWDFYPQYLQDRLSSIMTDPSVDAERKAKVLYLVSESLLERTFAEPDERAIRNAEAFVKDAVRYLDQIPHLRRRVAKLMDHDFTTYLHSTNVFFLAAGFAFHLGLPRSEVERLSLAALFHDLGKERVRREVLQKPGALTEDEWAEIRRHPIWSVQILREAKFGDEAVLRAVEQHHESPDGSGYPHGIGGQEISTVAAAVKVCDVFEALCGIRPYRPPYPPDTALEIMAQEVGPKIDSVLFGEFLGFLGNGR